MNERNGHWISKPENPVPWGLEFMPFFFRMKYSINIPMAEKFEMLYLKNHKKSVLAWEYLPIYLCMCVTVKRKGVEKISARPTSPKSNLTKHQKMGGQSKNF